MRRLIMWNMVTMNGYFEGSKSWDIGWHELAWGEELERLSKTGCVLLRYEPTR